MLYGTGVRRAEAAAATVGALDLSAGRLRIVGKGNKERDVFLPPGTLAAVLAWIDHRGSAEGPLFKRVNKAGAVQAAGITAQLIYHIVKKRHVHTSSRSQRGRAWQRRVARTADRPRLVTGGAARSAATPARTWQL